MVDRGKVGKQKKIKLTHLRQQQVCLFHPNLGVHTWTKLTFY